MFTYLIIIVLRNDKIDVEICVIWFRCLKNNCILFSSPKGHKGPTGDALAPASVPVEDKAEVEKEESDGRFSLHSML